MKSTAPSRMAATTSGMLPCAVTITTGTLDAFVPELAERFQPAELGHSKIQQHHAVIAPANQLEGRFAVTRLDTPHTRRTPGAVRKTSLTFGSSSTIKISAGLIMPERLSHRECPSASGLIGRVKVKVVPLPGSLAALDLAAVGDHDLAGDRQTQAGPSADPSPRARHAIELLKEPRQMLRSNSLVRRPRR